LAAANRTQSSPSCECPTCSGLVLPLRFFAGSPVSTAAAISDRIPNLGANSYACRAVNQLTISAGSRLAAENRHAMKVGLGPSWIRSPQLPSRIHSLASLDLRFPLRFAFPHGLTLSLTLPAVPASAASRRCVPRVPLTASTLPKGDRPRVKPNFASSCVAGDECPTCFESCAAAACAHRSEFPLSIRPYIFLRGQGNVRFRFVTG
jgi:hypothetical protein